MCVSGYKKLFNEDNKSKKHFYFGEGFLHGDNCKEKIWPYWDLLKTVLNF